jgi:predicted transposase YdaD
LFLLRHLAELEEPPTDLQEGIFSQLFEVAEIANFSSAEQVVYQDSLKYYRDMYSIAETLLQEGEEKGRREGQEAGMKEGLRQGEAALALRLLNRRVGPLAVEVESRVMALPLTLMEALGDALLDFESLSDLLNWLDEHPADTD